MCPVFVGWTGQLHWPCLLQLPDVSEKATYSITSAVGAPWWCLSSLAITSIARF